MFVDGELVAQRDQSLMARLFGGGWPGPERVVAEVGKRMARAP